MIFSQELIKRTLIILRIRHTTVAKVKEYFSRFGKIEGVQMHTNTPRPHAKIQFESFEQANSAFQGGQMVADGVSKHYIGDEFVFARFYIPDEDYDRRKVMIFKHCLLFVLSTKV